jgi:hypothetical protein
MNKFLDQVLIDTRKAYRLLHAYQRWIIDAVTYLGSQFDLEYNGGATRFSCNNIFSSRRKDSLSSWDWLPFLLFEFHYLKELECGGALSFSCFILSDTGYFEGGKEHVDKESVLNFASVADSTSKAAFILRHGRYEPQWDFLNDKEAVQKLLANNSLPEALQQRGFVAKCYDLAGFADERSISKIRDELLELAKEHELPLLLKKPDQEATK